MFPMNITCITAHADTHMHIRTQGFPALRLPYFPRNKIASVVHVNIACFRRAFGSHTVVEDDIELNTALTRYVMISKSGRARSVPSRSMLVWF